MAHTAGMARPHQAYTRDRTPWVPTAGSATAAHGACELCVHTRAPRPSSAHRPGESQRSGARALRL